MAVPIRTSTPHDSLRARGQRRIAIRGVLRVLGYVVVLAAFVWAVFGSSLLSVTSVRIEGNVTVPESGIRDIAQVRQNMLLMKTGALAGRISNAFPVLATVAIEKHYPHGLTVVVTERMAIGLWCRGEICQYVDHSGVRWGTPPRSRGALLLLIDDMRAEDSGNDRLAATIERLVGELPRLGLRPQWATLPGDSTGTIVIRVDRNYEVYVDALGDVDDQVETLDVFLKDRVKDPAFSPVYIDLRTPGRAYYK